MILLRAYALFWILLAVPLVLLYLRTRRPRRQAVATGFLWSRTFAEMPAGSAWRKWRRPATLGIHLLAVMLVVLAMAEPLARRPRRIVLVIDDSASMAAADPAPSRLESARQIALEYVARLDDRDRMAILTAGGRTAVRSTLTGDRDVLEQAVADVIQGDGMAHVTEAVGLGRRLLADCPGGEIVVLSDGCFQGSVELAAADDVCLIPIGTAADNVAVTALAVRRSLGDASGCRVLADVTSFAAGPLERRLEISLDGVAIDSLPVHLEPGALRQELFEITAPADGLVTARLEGRDVLPGDDCLSVRLPPPHRVAETTASAVDPPPPITMPEVNASAHVEGDVRVPAGLRPQDVPAAARRPGPPPWTCLAGIALLVMAGEWCLFQRRWTC